MKSGSKFKQNKKRVILLIGIIAIVCAVVIPTMAWLIAKTDPLTNRFEQAVIACEVLEPAAEGESYQVKNTGDTEAYVRVAVVANWTNTDSEAGGIVHTYWQENLSPTVTLSDNWQEIDGYYYYKLPLAVGATVDFATIIADASAAPEGYPDASIQLLAEAIQTQPDEAFDSWGVTLTP